MEKKPITLNLSDRTIDVILTFLDQKILENKNMVKEYTRLLEETSGKADEESKACTFIYSQFKESYESEEKELSELCSSLRDQYYSSWEQALSETSKNQNEVWLYTEGNTRTVGDLMLFKSEESAVEYLKARVSDYFDCEWEEIENKSQSEGENLLSFSDHSVEFNDFEYVLYWYVTRESINP